MRNKISGVYKITNTLTEDFYIGSSVNIKRRWACHKSPFRWKYQPNSKLYQDMQKYGLDNFLFEILEETNNIKEREQYWIGQLQPSYNNRRAKRTKEDILADSKEWRKYHHEEWLASVRKYKNKLCLYDNETISLQALTKRFRKQGILHSAREASKYLI